MVSFFGEAGGVVVLVRVVGVVVLGVQRQTPSRVLCGQSVAPCRAHSWPSRNAVNETEDAQR